MQKATVFFSGKKIIKYSNDIVTPRVKFAILRGIEIFKGEQFLFSPFFYARK